MENGEDSVHGVMADPRDKVVTDSLPLSWLPCPILAMAGITLVILAILELKSSPLPQVSYLKLLAGTGQLCASLFTFWYFSRIRLVYRAKSQVLLVERHGFKLRATQAYPISDVKDIVIKGREHGSRGSTGSDTYHIFWNVGLLLSSGEFVPLVRPEIPYKYWAESKRAKLRAVLPAKH